MRELSLIGWLYVSFACFHAALPARRPAWWPASSPLAYRGVGGAFFLLALGLGLASFDVTTALLVLSLASGAVATLFVLLAPAFPRAAWTSVVLTLPCAAALFFGAAHA